MKKIIKILIAAIVIVILFTWRAIPECLNGGCGYFYVKILGALIVVTLVIVAVIREKK